MSQLKQQARIIFEHSQQDFLGRQRFGIQLRQQRRAAIPAIVIKCLQQFLDAIGLRIITQPSAINLGHSSLCSASSGQLRLPLQLSMAMAYTLVRFNS